MSPLANQPIPYNLFLNDRRFEEFTNDIYKQDIDAGEFGNQFDDITLLNGTHEQGRDCVLHKNGHNVGVVQCKLLSISLTKPTSVKEIIKFCLYSILNTEFIHDRSTFEYHFVCPKGFNNTTILFLKDFKNQILNEVKLDEWIKAVIKNNSSLQVINFEDSKERLYDILSSITVKPIIGNDLDRRFSKAHNQNLYNKYFDSKTVVDNTALIPILEKLDVFLDRSKITAGSQVDVDYNHFITTITPKQYHLPRKIQSAHGNNETKPNHDLISLIEKNEEKNIVVLASAGMGKTEELKQTAITLANRKLKYPIFVSFSKFIAEKDIEYFLPKGWLNIPKEKLVLLFDGFDELIDNEIHIIQRKLLFFAENNPEITIVVSCRTNFDYVDKDGYSETLNGFTAYYLQALTYEDVVNYVTVHHGLNGSMFMNAVYHRQFDDLIYNPFYLQIFIPDFKQNNSFSGNRTQLFQKFIIKSFSWDKKHFATNFNPNVEKERALELLRKVSIAMEMLGSRNIDSTKLHTLISDQFDFKLIRNCAVFKKEEGIEQWKFEHNNFQEILCAEKLAELPFETVIDLISFKGYKKIQPSWTNTVSFLISLLDENETLFQPLVDWIICYDPEILVKVEKERIPQKIRNEIFIQIFEYYKGLNIWINSNNFSYFDLAYFGQSDITIEFITNEILNSYNSRRTRFNAINIISDFQINDYQVKNQVGSKLMLLLKGEALDSEFIYAVIIAINKLGYTGKDTVDELMGIYLERASQYIRAAMYSIINTSKLVDLYIDYYISGLEIYLSKYTISADRESTSFFDEYYNLFEGIFNLKTIKATSKFIDYYLQNYSKIEGEFEIEEHFDRLIYNCIELYKTEKTILDYMCKLLSSESYNSWTTTKELKTLLFFKETNTKKEAIIKTLLLFSSDSENIYAHITLLSKLIEEENIMDLIEAYNNQTINEADLVRICKYFHSINQPLSELLKNEIYKSTGTIVEFQIQPNYDEIRRSKAQRSFDILFDIELFKNECLRVFEQKDELHVSDLYDHKINTDKDLESFYPASVLFNLRRFKNESGVVAKSEIIDWFDTNPNVTNFITSRIYSDLKDKNTKLCISTLQVEYIKNWFVDNIYTIDFINALEKGEGTSYTINWHAIFCIYFMEKFNFECPEAIHLDMLVFTFNANYVSFESIIKKVDKEKVESRIISNIKNRVIKNDSVYINHAEYIFQNNIYDVFSYIFEDLCDGTFDQYYMSSIIDLFFKYQANAEPLKLFLDKLNFETQTVVLKYLVKNDDLEYSTTKLLNLHKEGLDEETEKTINNLLISCKNIDGLEFSINWIEKYKVSPFSQHEQRLVYFETLDSLPLFLRLLELGYDTEIKIGNVLNGMLSIVLEGIYYLAIQSELNFNEVCSKLKEFIKVNKGKLEEVEFLNATIERIKEKFFQTHSEKYSIREIKTKITLLSL